MLGLENILNQQLLIIIIILLNFVTHPKHAF